MHIAEGYLESHQAFCKEDEEILHAFCFTPDMTTDEIIEKTRENLWKYFSYKPIKVAKHRAYIFYRR